MSDSEPVPVEKAKPVVYYNKDKASFVSIGKSAMVYPLNHSSNRVSNRSVCMTSDVVSHNENTGLFETLNSVYVPITKTEFAKLVLFMEAEAERVRNPKAWKRSS